MQNHSPCRKYENEVPHVAVIRGAATGLMDVFANVADVVIFGTDGYASIAAPSAVLAKDGKNPSDAKKYLGKDAAENRALRHLNTLTSQLLKPDCKRTDVPVGRKQNRR